MRAIRVDHTGIAVRDLDDAIKRYQSTFGAEATERTTVEDQGVEVAILSFGDTKLELIRPLTPESPVGRFVERRGESLHHIALQVEDIHRELGSLREAGVRLIDEEPRRGAHGLVAFVHPGASGGILIELIERTADDVLQG